MTPSIIQRFIQALHKVDQTGETREMTDLFSEKCEISNVAIKPLHGKKGVERFWRDYVDTLKQAKTRFTHVYEAEGRGFLEWVSQGVLPSGRPIIYEGLTILESRAGKIERFKAYHDSAVFLKEGAKHVEMPAGDAENVHPISTSKVMEGGPRRDISTPGEGVLTSTLKDRDAATG